MQFFIVLKSRDYRDAGFEGRDEVEDPLGEYLEQAGLGEVTGGGAGMGDLVIDVQMDDRLGVEGVVSLLRKFLLERRVPKSTLIKSGEAGASWPVEELLARVERFISEPMPPPTLPAFDHWQDQCRQLGPDAPSAFIELLRRGHEANYEILLALRAWGWEAWGEPEQGFWTFRVRPRQQGEWIVIHPSPPLPYVEI